MTGSKRFAVIAVTMFMIGAVLTPAASAGPNDVEGTVFRDYDFDGSKLNDPGEGGISITATDAAGLTASTTSAADGTYALDVSALADPVRIEFSIPASMTHLRPGPMGLDNRSDVVVASTGDENVDFGVINPAHFCQDNPNVITSCYVEGDQLAGPNAGGDVLVQTEFLAQGDGTPGGGGTAEFALTTASTIGTTYGLAIQTFNDNDPTNDVIWAASFMKRFAGYGPNGPGAIYELDVNGSPVGGGGVTIAAGTAPHDFTATANPDFVADPINFPDDTGVEVSDTASYGEVGKQGFGDIDVSEDDTKLYATNLFDRTLYEIDVDPTSGTYRSVLQFWPLTGLNGQSCGGSIRPGAVGVNDGQVYVGTTCDDATVAYVHTIDTATGTNALELTIPLTYARQTVGANSGYLADWNAWDDSFGANETGWGYDEVAYPQPWLMDLEFDRNGMIIGIRDRYGDQTGDDAPDPGWPNGTGIYEGPNGLAPNVQFRELYSTDSAGDILRACDSATGFDLEGSGSCSVTNGGAVGATPAGVGGPAGIEWYDGDDYRTDFGGNIPGHNEVSHGGLFNHVMRDEVLMTGYDTLDDAGTGTLYAFSQGLARLDNVSGDKVGDYRGSSDMRWDRGPRGA